MMKKKVPSLVDLCVNTAIDNVRYLGDVGETDNHLLERILPHCTLQQLMHVENSTEGRDLSPVTGNLWKKFYKSEFGEDKTEEVVQRMKKYRVSFPWKNLYEEKLRHVEEEKQKKVDQLRKRYREADELKQSRRIQLCTKVPPSSNKRSWGGGGSGVSNMKSGLMKKAKLDFINSREVKNLAAMRKNSLLRNKGVSLNQKAGGFSGKGKGSASSSKINKPGERRTY